MARAANDLLSPRNNPEFLDKLFRAVTVDSAFRHALPQQLSSAGQHMECLWTFTTNPVEPNHMNISGISLMVSPVLSSPQHICISSPDYLQ